MIYNKSKNDRLWALKDGEYSLAYGVIALLLQEDRLTVYRIKKRLEEIEKSEIPYSTLHGVINDLAKSKHITLAEKKPFRTKMEKKLYSITSMGVNALIHSLHFPNSALEPEYVIQYILKKQNLNSFLQKAEQWKMAETPNLLLALFSFSRVFDAPYRGTVYTKDKIFADLVKMLNGLIFYDYFQQSLKKADFCWGMTTAASYTDEVSLLATAEIKREAKKFVDKNPWIKADLLKDLASWINWAQAELDFAKQTIEYCKPLLS